MSGIDIAADYDDIRRIVLKCVTTPLGVSVEDFLQEVYMALVKKNGQNCRWDPARSSKSHYIVMVARSTAANLAPKAKRHLVPVYDESELAAEADPRSFVDAALELEGTPLRDEAAPCVCGWHVPQASSLDTVRSLVEARYKGIADLGEQAEHLSISRGAARFATIAAGVLGWLGARGVTATGADMLRTTPDTARERAHRREAISESPLIGLLAPDFLRVPPGIESLAGAIVSATRMSPATARVRARCMLSWRRQALGAGSA